MKHLRQITEGYHVIDTHTGKRVYSHGGIGYGTIDSLKHARKLNSKEWNETGKHDRYKVVNDEGKGLVRVSEKNKKESKPKSPSTTNKKKQSNKYKILKFAAKSIAAYAAYRGLKHLLGYR